MSCACCHVISKLNIFPGQFSGLGNSPIFNDIQCGHDLSVIVYGMKYFADTIKYLGIERVSWIILVGPYNDMGGSRIKFIQKVIR